MKRDNKEWNKYLATITDELNGKVYIPHSGSKVQATYAKDFEM